MADYPLTYEQVLEYQERRTICRVLDINVMYREYYGISSIEFYDHFIVVKMVGHHVIIFHLELVCGPCDVLLD